MKKPKYVEYDFKEYKSNTIESSVDKYGNGNIYTAIFNMEAKIASLKVESDNLREMINWDELTNNEEKE